MIDRVIKWTSGSAVSDGNLKQSLLVVIVVAAQLLVSVAVARTIIFLLLLISGDVEQNPGPDFKLLAGPALSFYCKLCCLSNIL